ncbi:MAG: hypothetical protein L0177_07710 [Chloroflexi bacterium]|nr:hypothetical protein [Chloroflexota bacterium]
MTADRDRLLAAAITAVEAYLEEEARAQVAPAIPKGRAWRAALGNGGPWHGASWRGRD